MNLQGLGIADSTASSTESATASSSASATAATETTFNNVPVNRSLSSIVELYKEFSEKHDDTQMLFSRLKRMGSNAAESAVKSASTEDASKQIAANFSRMQELKKYAKACKLMEKIHEVIRNFEEGYGRLYGRLFAHNSKSEECRENLKPLKNEISKLYPTHEERREALQSFPLGEPQIIATLFDSIFQNIPHVVMGSYEFPTSEQLKNFPILTRSANEKILYTDDIQSQVYIRATDHMGSNLAVCIGFARIDRRNIFSRPVWLVLSKDSIYEYSVCAGSLNHFFTLGDPRKFIGSPDSISRIWKDEFPSDFPRTFLNHEALFGIYRQLRGVVRYLHVEAILTKIFEATFPKGLRTIVTDYDSNSCLYLEQIDPNVRIWKLSSDVGEDDDVDETTTAVAKASDSAS